MKLPVYQWDTGELLEQEIPLPTSGDMLSKGEVYRLINGIMAEKISVPSMNLLEFLEVYPDSICRKIITSTHPTVYQFESLEHGVSIYLQHAAT